jgi:hypothetical protein
MGLRYYKAHPEILRRPPPSLFTTWSRASRLTFVWVSILLTVVVAIPILITSVFVMLDAETCTILTSVSGACHSVIRLGIAAGIEGLIVIGTLKLILLLTRIQNFPGDSRAE